MKNLSTIFQAFKFKNETDCKASVRDRIHKSFAKPWVRASYKMRNEFLLSV
ncbi:MAG: hypothetical protein HC942_23225 [Microcoleus sp. SU_5_6]|nr:hypothetical protein [Microcoleus sp. SU_5_6]